MWYNTDRMKAESQELSPWLFNGRPFTSEMIGNSYGFVYCITNTINNRKYIGRKYFYSSRKKVGKRRKFKESDWKSYWSSCDELKEDVKKYGEDKFIREILSIHATKGDCNYYENLLLFKNEVLEEDKEEKSFYNNNIMSRYFSRSMKKVAIKRRFNKRPISNIVFNGRRISEAAKQRGHK